MLSELSTEVIRRISAHLERRDQLVLSRTSRRMHAISAEWIYRVLIFIGPIRLLECCKSIISRSEAAISVWELTIHCPNTSHTLQSFCSVLRSATERMKNLRVIRIFSLRLFHSIFDIVFPQLTHCTIPHSSNSYSFFRRNPTIEYISIISGSDARKSSPNDFYHIQPMHMPQLRHFQGPNSAIRAVVPGAPVSVLTIWWDCESADLEFSCGLAAAASSKADLCELANMIVSWDPDLLRAIARYTPRIQFLDIRMIRPGSTRKKEHFLSAIDDALCSLTCLAKFVASDYISTSLPLDQIGATLDSEFDRVRRWGKICPTLTRITLSATWNQDGEKGQHLWLPATFIPSPSRSGECFRWFIKKIAMSPELPAGYRGVANYFAGVDAMQVLTEAAEREEVLPSFDILHRTDGRTYISFPFDR
ncbi:hypothetical protein C8R45DRAFT_1179861 [Mycena sanguinolenta]|nr:hypothetical protein C8R45DRAFT_1179861 [Mycena sanguinolenta]